MQKYNGYHLHNFLLFVLDGQVQKRYFALFLFLFSNEQAQILEKFGSICFLNPLRHFDF